MTTFGVPGGDGQSEDKRRIWAWAFYDWANSAFATTVMAGFFPLFFKSWYSAEADVLTSTARLGLANGLASLVIVLLAPLLGAIADTQGLKKRFLLLFTWLGILMSGSLALVGQGQWELAIVVYILGNTGFMGANTFYDALLPSVTRESNFDRISALGYSLGYLGGGLLFTLNIAAVTFPHLFLLQDSATAVRLSFVSVALWWFLFSLPIFLLVREQPLSGNTPGLTSALRQGTTRLWRTLGAIKKLRQLRLFLIAYWLYIDGVDTIIRMAVDYGMAIGFSSNSLIIALLLVQFIGFPATLLFARLARCWQARQAVVLAIAIYLLITLWASLMNSLIEFYLLAMMIALVQGGIQALSRSCYARMIPPGHSAEFFGFFNLLGKFAAVLGPVLMGIVAVASGSSRLSIASVSIFFLLGGMLLVRVDTDEAAREAKKSDL